MSNLFDMVSEQNPRTCSTTKPNPKHWFVVMVNLTDVVQTGSNSTNSILEDLMARMTEVLTKNQTQTHLSTYDASAAQISIKLDGTNYAL